MSVDLLLFEVAVCEVTTRILHQLETIEGIIGVIWVVLVAHEVVCFKE